MKDEELADEFAEMDSFVPHVNDPESPEGLRVSASWWLISVGRMWRNLLDQRLQTSDQTQPRWRVLAWARMKPGITQQEMAARMQVSGPTLARILDGLEKKTMVVRRVDARDRRIKEIYLSDHAYDVVDEISKEVDMIRNEILSDIDDEEMKNFLSTLYKIRNRIKSIRR